ncbi:MAG: peptidoglycan-associated lipoprotein Pal [Syntrophales bacterium]|jgi:peptidoglycan-associated lipoprotein|nr:peptidoglycan-associated lipoprotein Pal [Syntrophales bacterium]MCK9528746.1 peptidoglycan-associated lipoprotein Pal [Syntrophales bacterium]MDX9922963.1 peptidoglycan-associated lipoprotein Pal [Syntrophales bacterium]
MKRDWRRWYTVAFVLFFLVFALSGCAKYKESVVKETAVPAEETVAPTEKPVLSEEEKAKLLREALIAEAEDFKTKNIYFDFDKYSLKPEARAILDNLGAWLLKNGNFHVVIEGHCDERGTAEYNLALGERRANAAKTYLANLGVDGKRMKTISYGEERPLDPRSNEEAWAKNRRGRFNVSPAGW